jgi:hypothetical protein
MAGKFSSQWIDQFVLKKAKYFIAAKRSTKTLDTPIKIHMDIRANKLLFAAQVL